MREIKFRAWDEEDNRMIYNIHLNYHEVEGTLKPVIPGYQWFNEENKIYNSEPMQYTGLKDTNGKEIYEGDIVKDKSVPVKGVVEFGKFTHCDYPEYGYFVKDKENINFPLETYDIYFKIIGNKYENPELLKEVNNENITK